LYLIHIKACSTIKYRVFPGIIDLTEDIEGLEYGMPELSWIGKDKIVNHDKELPYRVLKANPQLSVGDKSENLIIQGDNLEALKSLMPTYYNRIKCVYIDPPYNTGNEGWKYNDKVNSPQIKAWLNDVVGPEGEDLCRHDKWLSMMYPRLKLLHQLLKDDGIIFISIDNNEYHNLQAIMDEIFGVRNYVGTVIWKNANDNNPTNVSVEHEYIVCYAKSKPNIESVWKSTNIDVKQKLEDISEELNNKYSDPEEVQTVYTKWFRENKAHLWPFDRYKFIDKGGVYTGSQSVHNPGKEGYRYDVLHPVTGKPCVEPLMGYRFPQETMNRLIKEGKILFGKDEKKIIELKLYAKDYKAKLSSVYELDGRTGTNEIKTIFPEDKRPFNFPKPSVLIEDLISFVTKDDDIILDSFAGSGTTAHAVLNLNKADGGNRKFILVELEKSIAHEITAERVKRVINGYPKSRYPEGTGGSFQFLDLNGKLFNEDGFIGDHAQYDDLAAYIYYTETKKHINLDAIKNPYIGSLGSKDYYLLFKKPKRNVLDQKIAEEFSTKGKTSIIYADKCLIDEEKLSKLGIIFKQIPYEIKKY
jgi:adenine-specific DNA-methyltransferase